MDEVENARRLSKGGAGRGVDSLSFCSGKSGVSDTAARRMATLGYALLCCSGHRQLRSKKRLWNHGQSTCMLKKTRCQVHEVATKDSSTRSKAVAVSWNMQTSPETMLCL